MTHSILLHQTYCPMKTKGSPTQIFSGTLNVYDNSTSWDSFAPESGEKFDICLLQNVSRYQTLFKSFPCFYTFFKGKNASIIEFPNRNLLIMIDPGMTSLCSFQAVLNLSFVSVHCMKLGLQTNCAPILSPHLSFIHSFQLIKSGKQYLPGVRTPTWGLLP